MERVKLNLFQVLILKEIGKIQSLSRNDETELAKQLESFNKQLVDIFSKSTVIVKYLNPTGA